jgi:hypothetical protein
MCDISMEKFLKTNNHLNIKFKSHIFVKFIIFIFSWIPLLHTSQIIEIELRDFPYRGILHDEDRITVSVAVTDQILDVKNKIAEQTGVNGNNIRLRIAGRLLDNGDVIARTDYLDYFIWHARHVRYTFSDLE